MAMRRKVVLLTPALLTGCAGWQSTLDPHSNQAAHLSDLFWFFTIVCGIVWVLVAAALIINLARRRSGDDTPEEDTPSQTRRKSWIVASLVALTAVVLTVFTFASFYTTRGFTWADTHAITIKVTGQQWWWQIEYQNEDPAQLFSTANEIHIPVGRPVTLQLEAADVIHSFWVPNLMGNQDMIPGRKNLLTLQADRPGLYRGQCAEFCGLEHAKMAILVFAEPQEKFEAWRRHEIEAAAVPGAPQRVKGMQLFVQGPCAVCHTVNGTDAGGHTAPDLTHFGGRATIAAGLLHNTPQNLAHWLADPQGLKPGSNMPKIDLSQSDRTALVAYLEGLK
jgi:cytochrome c oxidase subunit 2